jgi:hypothetical protein
MFTVIESGALVASCTLIMFVLDMTGSPSGFMAFNVAIQIATTTPLLIITRLGLGLTSIVQIDITEDTCTYPMAPISPFATRKTGSMHSFFREV